MAMFIMYHFFNRREYPNDTRFVDNFLIVTPGITIKERLGVLFVDILSSPNFKKDYYHVRGLVPTTLEPFLPELNNHIVITNYHVFEPKVLKGNKRSPFDGKMDSTGKKRTGTEDQNLVIKRVLPFKPGTRLLIINDEAHRLCYLPKTASKGESADKEENKKRAAVLVFGTR